jgi:hypothetical protein
MFLAIPFSSSAALIATIVFQGAVGPSDGADYVLPYQISIDGVSTLADCYDFNDGVVTGQTWIANLFGLSEAAASGYFSGVSSPTAKYERVAWLSAQTFANTSQQIALQHAIWSVFGVGAPVGPDPDYSNYLLAADAAAAGGYVNFNFAGFIFVEEKAGAPNSTPPFAQAFVYTTIPPTSTTSLTSSPEPDTIAMLASGLLILFAATRFRRLATTRN